MPAERIVFMGTPEFALPPLEALLSSEYSVAAVYTQPDRPAGRGRGLQASPVKRLAQARGIEVLQPARLREPGALERLAAIAPDAIVVAAFGQLLPAAVLAVPRFGCLNVHPSLLPRHRGASPIPWAILEGDAVTGATIMLMDAGMDTGPVLSQHEEPVGEEDTAGTLGERLSRLGAFLLLETLPGWFGGRIRPCPQDEERATYTRVIAKEDGEIDWKLPADVLWRRVRAFLPWPVCHTRWQGQTLRVLKAAPLVPQGGTGEPGRVVTLAPGKMTGCQVGVETGRGVLGLLVVQLEGRRPMPATDFARGARGFVGALLR